MSNQPTLLLDLDGDEDTSRATTNALENAGIFHIVESRVPLKVRVSAQLQAVAVLTTILEDKIDSTTGKITLPDNTTFVLNRDGLKQLKSVLISKLQVTPSASAQAPQAQSGNSVVDIFKEALKDPDATGKLVREIANALRGDPQVALEETKQVSRFTLTIMGLMATVIIGSSILGYFGRLGGDTVGLVYGTVIGSSFAFLYKYLASPEEAQ